MKFRHILSSIFSNQGHTLGLVTLLIKILITYSRYNKKTYNLKFRLYVYLENSLLFLLYFL